MRVIDQEILIEIQLAPANSTQLQRVNAGFLWREDAFHDHGEAFLVRIRDGAVKPAMLDTWGDFGVNGISFKFSAVEDLEAQVPVSHP